MTTHHDRITSKLDTVARLGSKLGASFTCDRGGMFTINTVSTIQSAAIGIPAVPTERLNTRSCMDSAANLQHTYTVQDKAPALALVSVVRPSVCLYTTGTTGITVTVWISDQDTA
jgi:hypothetical protein